MLINEFATLKKEVSHLPTTIWLDEDQLYLPHVPRIKFKCCNEQRNTHQYSSMSISEDPECFNVPYNHIFRKKDFEKLKEFVIENKDLLIALANKEIDFQNDFMNKVKF